MSRKVGVVNEFIVDPKVKELRDHRATAAAALDDGNVHCSGATRVRVPLHVALLSPLKCEPVDFDRGCVNLRPLLTESHVPPIKPKRPQSRPATRTGRRGRTKTHSWDSSRCRRGCLLLFCCAAPQGRH